MQFSIVYYSSVKTSSNEFRIDPEYYKPEYVRLNKKLKSAKPCSEYIDYLTDGTHQTPSYKSKGIPFLSSGNVHPCDLQFKNTKYISLEEHKNLKHCQPTYRDILISKSGRIGHAAVVPVDYKKGDFNIYEGIALLRVKDYSPYALALLLNSRILQDQIRRVQKGVAQPHLHLEDIRILKIPSFSDEFIKLLEVTYKDIETTSSNSRLNNAQALSHLYSELGLTSWQPKHKLTFIKNYSDTQQAERIDAEYFQPKYDEIISAIKAYRGGWDTLGKLVDVKKSVEVGSNEYVDEGVPFVRVSNISPFEISEEKYISEQLYTKLTPNEQDVPFIKSKNHQPQQGEILFSKDGSPGIAYHLKNMPQKMIVSGGILRLKNKTDKVSNEYLTLVLNSVLTQEQVKRDVGGSIILHWRPDQVKETTIPILSEDKQQEIQQKVTESFNLRKQSKHLLECAKKAVEIAIEQDEQKATNWLENETNEMQI